MLKFKINQDLPALPTGQAGGRQVLTPQKQYPKLATILGLKTELWLKREDLHPLGSHKGRSLPVMINQHAARGARNFVISSSGNAALAALLYIKKHNQNKASPKINLTIFVGPKIPSQKLAKLLKTAPSKNIVIKQTQNPKQSAFQFAKNNGVVFLRQSTDKFAPLGYQELAAELAKIKNLGAIFVPTSSGTTAVGLYAGFKKLNKSIKIFIVQTTSCHPFVGNAYMRSLPEKKEVSLATAIVDHIAHRKAEILKLLKTTAGKGLVVNNSEIISSQKLVANHCLLNISPNSALSIAGLRQAIKNGSVFARPVVCLITGD
ncbi:MAG: PLP-dependent lyase/thiolase [Candidatus Magasanikbacteria bacterium]|nr:PLP-dependent lyase/thiolase [Candidatus Magasanikbacteria bacterium]